MPHNYDPGYGTEPFRSLCNQHPDVTDYPQDAFRVEWGPIFHRGRLDGSARILVIGQDPASHETIVRRVLVGEAGQRLQGFLYKLGIDQSYVIINTFLYSVYGQSGGNRHKNDPGIIAYRNRWLDAVLLGKQVEAVVALGGLAEDAWLKWKATPSGLGFNTTFAKITHPTFPESAGGTAAERATNVKSMLTNWNSGLQTLKPAIAHPDAARALVNYGESFGPSDLKEIPEIDVPFGLPPWMRGLKAWATRSGTTAAQKRATIKITVPSAFLP
jgi:uracil-DNA glycosylase